MASADNFITYFEKSEQLDSPDYKETIEYFKKLQSASPYSRLKEFGVSAQGRAMYCVIIDKGRKFTPKSARRKGKVVVLIQNGIHPGEIEGKDATMLLLREILITKEKKHLLEHLVLIVIPVLNVDGHERTSPYNRPNQNGPLTTGWRVTAHNLNLNRDYMKADTPEMKALLRLFTQWMPDFIIDNHTTNGADYQYHISYGIERKESIDQGLARFAVNVLVPHFTEDLERAGFLSAPYLDFKGDGPESGLVEMVGLPRFSTGYAALQNRISLLVETHSLKPFANRVFSTKRINESVLDLLHREHKKIKRLNESADRSAVTQFCLRKKKLPLTFRLSDEQEDFLFKGKEFDIHTSSIMGCDVRRYRDVPKDVIVPLFRKIRVVNEISVPKYYIIPKEFSPVIRVMRLHGISVKTLSKSVQAECERYHFDDLTFAPYPYEGRQRVSVTLHTTREVTVLPQGTFIIPTRQKAVRLIVNLLEPAGEDSFVSWGFFHAFFERKEYAEAYVFEPIASAMYAQDNKLKEEFDMMLKVDTQFRNDPLKRLDFFYRNSPYFDSIEKKYVILRSDHSFRGLAERFGTD